MKCKTIYFLLLCMTSVLSVAQPPAGYYAGADGKGERTLKAALKEIIANHTKIRYANLWKAYEKVDYVQNVTNSAGNYKVYDYYSSQDFFFNGDGSAVSGMNKEHVAPQSWWGKGTSINVGCDLIQVIPSEAKANNAKGNYPLGVVTGTVSFSNDCVKTGRGSNGKLVFEPCDEYKGDFARIYFYVATCYPDVEWRDVGDVECAFTQEDYPTLKSDFIALLLRWHRQDPVCQWEQTRNDRAYEQQKNRNPFVDYPELAEFIWGDRMTDAFHLDGSDDQEKNLPTFDLTYEVLTAYNEPFTILESAITGGPATLTVTPAEAATVSGLTVTPVYAGALRVTVSTAATSQYLEGSEDFTLSVSQPEPQGGGKVLEYQGVLFDETFSGCTGTGGNDAQFAGNVASNKMTMSGASRNTDEEWGESATVYSGDACMRFGSSGGEGSFQTLAIPLVGRGKLTFRAAGWGSGTNKLTVTATGGTLDGNTAITLTNSSWEDYSIDITGAAGALVLTFKGKRGFVDDVMVCSNETSDEFLAETVTLNEDGLATFASHYTLDVSGAGDYSVWRAVAVRDGALLLRPVTGIVAAGTPLILRGEADATLSLPTTDAEATAYPDPLLTALLAPTVVWAGEYMGLDGERFMPIEDECAILETEQAILSMDQLEEADGNTALSLLFVPEGDVNADGQVTVTDIAALIDIIMENTVPDAFTAAVADLNGDGEITVTDVSALISLIMEQ